MAKRKQQNLPTMEPVRSTAIDGAAERYAEARDARMAKGKEEKECKEELLGLMETEGIAEYENGDVWVKVESKKNVKVRIGGNEPPEDDEE